MTEPTREHWHELWGTCSVIDHTRPDAFVAEVLLCDKLVVPVPPTVKHGISGDEAAREWERWSAAGWDPNRQRRMLEVLGDRAECVPWTQALQAQWRVTMATLFADARRTGYFGTGTVLQGFAPAMARAVVAVSQHHSLAELERAGIRRCQPDEKLPGSSLLAVLGHELLLPGEPQQDDDDDFLVLRKAVEVAKNPTYRTRRRALYDWQQDFLAADGTTDARSIQAAVAHMQRLVDDLKTATGRQTGWTWSKKVFSFLGAASKGAGLLFPPLALAATATDAVISFGKFVAEEGAGVKRPDSPSLPAASLILDAREKLGIEGR